MPFKLFKYTSSIFIKHLLVTILIFSSSFLIIDLIELTIRTKSNASFFITIKTALAHVPFIIQETSLLLLFSSLIYTFVSLAKYNEYTAIKASGISLRQFLLPFICVSFLFSTIIITVINPISAHLLLYRDNLLHITLSPTTEPLILSKHGILLLDMPKHSKEELYIISAEHLKEVSSNEIYLYKTSYIVTSPDYVFKKRMDAEKSVLRKNEWTLTNVIEKQAKQNSVHHLETTLPSSLQPQDLINSFRRPKQISIWTLPKFINTLKIIGGSTERYTKYLYKLVITPFLTIGLVCLAASFSLKSHRNKKNQHILTYGISLGFTSFIYIEILMKLNILDTFQAINPIITVISFTLIGITTLFYSEKNILFS